MMRALLLSEYKHLSVVDMPVPSIGEDEVLVRVKACGVCGSDIHGYDGSTGRRIPPLVMGHEAAGVIERAGSRVEGFAAGDRVTFDSMVSCGACDVCRRGQINLCDNRMVLGVSCGDYRRHGAFAEYVAVPARILYKLPADLPFARAALTEAVSIAVHAVNRRMPTPDETAVVVGAGMSGLLTIQVLKVKGVRTIIAVDVDAGKLELARRMGAAQLLNATAVDVPAAVADLTGARGADVAVSVSSVLWVTTSTQSVPQLMPGGDEVTVPAPLPSLKILSVPATANVAVRRRRIGRRLTARRPCAAGSRRRALSRSS